jgi:hypothetical protein
MAASTRFGVGQVAEDGVGSVRGERLDRVDARSPRPIARAPIGRPQSMSLGVSPMMTMESPGNFQA